MKQESSYRKRRDQGLGDGEWWSSMASTRALTPFPKTHTPVPALLASCLLLLVSACSAAVKTGADVLVEQRLDLVKGRNIGLITNQTGRLSTGEFLIDALRAHGVHVVALFAPEHGIRGQAEAGASVKNDIDSVTGIPIYSLYGPNMKIDGTMLEGVDLLLYDIQDVGARFYTYISTLGLSMEAASEKGIPFVVLDRPDPLGGVLTDGPIMQDSLRSFVGMYPLPVVYGLTCGELAQMINREGWLSKGMKADLTVVPMQGWGRDMSWAETELPWVPPSPNIPTPSTAFAYPATCYIEGTNLSEGRGTSRPFSQFGAPFLNAGAIAAALDSLRLPGVRFGTTTFIPSSSKLAGHVCQGVTIEVTDPRLYHPVAVGLHIVDLLGRRYPKECGFDLNWLCRLFGSGEVRNVIGGDRTADEVINGWNGAKRAFLERARLYWLY